jgi:hypothetical protein
MAMPIGPNAQPPTPSPVTKDVIDRTIELLNCSIDHANASTERICRILDKICGPVPADPTPAIQSPLSPKTIAQALGDLERAQSLLSAQLDRFREQEM